MWSFKRVVSTRPVSVDIGLLIIRLVIGLSMAVFHGYGKITGGPAVWAGIGSNMSNLGITFTPAMWGFMAASAEFFGSILLILGVLFRPAAALLAFTMFVAALRHLNLPVDNPATGWKGASHAIELLAVYGALFFTGPGRYASTLIVKPRREL
jgi:putative oxidoreductase